MGAFRSQICFTVTIFLLYGLACRVSGAEFPLLKVYEFKEGKVISVDAEPNSDLILPDNGNDTERYLVLQCKAPYPVQWIYSGDGIPEFITNTSVNWDVQPIEFVASAGIFRVAEYHTGSYYCKSIQNPALSMHYYLFITGEKLFTAAGGTIFFSRKDPKIRIPCSASNPKVRVTLQKLDMDYVNCPSNDTITFDIKTGFTLKATHIHQPEGEYLCIAAFKGAYKFIEYKLVSSDTPTKAHQQTREPEDDEIPGRLPPAPISSVSTTGNRLPGFTHHTATPGGPIYSSSFVQAVDQRQPKPPPGCKSFPCGRYAYCTLSAMGKPVCKCEKHFRGDPYTKCDPECVIDFDCPSNRVCNDNACEDPCPEVCGPANGRVQSCKVVNHMPICSYNHCNPSPCGPFSKCEDLKHTAHCTCLHGYHGSPPNCSPIPVTPTRIPSTTNAVSLSPTNSIPDSPVANNGSPEDDSMMEMDAFQCRDHNQCPEDLRCTDYKCSDPCVPNPCGRRTVCRVIDHEPICSCAPGFTKVNQNCLPTNCRSQRDCPDNKSCVRNRCINPCAGYCGSNTECLVEGHYPKCTCAEGYTGNPSQGCQRIPELTTLPTPGIIQPDIPKLCGDMKCGRNSKCIVQNSEPMCKCEPGFSGDPQRFCYQIISNPEPESSVFDEDRMQETQIKFENVRPSTTQRTTSRTTYRTTRPPATFRTTTTSTSRPGGGKVCFHEEDCVDNMSCLAGSCLDPCKFFNICGENQDCIVKDHKANCICKPGYPVKLYNNCYKRENRTNTIPCSASHCGSNSDCILTEHGPICRCKAGYVGIAPNCKPEPQSNNDECREDYQCPELLACVNSTCINPCVGQCGVLARCRVYLHRAKCFCPQGFHGDPRVRCSVPLFKFSTREEEVGQNSRAAAKINNHSLELIDWDEDVFETETEDSPTDAVTVLDNEDTTVIPEKDPPTDKFRSDLPPPAQFTVKILTDSKKKSNARESLARFDLSDDEYFDDSLEMNA